MYCSFFGFAEKPFEVTPDPKFLYLSPSHQEMLASLVYGIRERRGFIVVSGEVGTGKTTLINAVLDRLDEQTKVACIYNTAVTFDQLLQVALLEFGLNEPDVSLSKIEAIRRLNEFTIGQLSSGGNVVLIVDEAQNLSEDSLENLRLLSNLETRKHKLIQIVLSGQPELDVKLNRPELRQLAQRISVRRRIRPLTQEETYAYIQHRLSVAGSKSSRIFDGNAQKMIYDFSKGIPRKINVLCDNALLIGFAVKKRQITTNCLTEAAADLNWFPVPGTREEIPEPAESPPLYEQSRPRRFGMVASLGLIIGVVLVGWVMLDMRRSAVETGKTFFLTRGLETTVNSVQGRDVEPLQRPLVSPSRDKLPPIEPVKISPAQTPDPRSTIALNETQPPGKFIGVIRNNGEDSLLTSIEPVKAEVGPSVAGPPKTEPSHDFALRPNRSLHSGSLPILKVTVRSGETLSGIIVRHYGEYNSIILNAVMRENTQVLDPDKIYEGQDISLPGVD